MPELKTEYTRQLLKRTSSSGQTPTTTTATTIDSSWLNTDIMIGEMFANIEDDKLWFRSNNGVVEVSTATSGTPYDFCSTGIQVSSISGCSPVSIYNDLNVISGITADTLTVRGDSILGTLNVTYGITADTLNLSSGLSFGTGSTETRTRIYIGDWDMDATASVNIEHGLSSSEWKTISAPSVIIRDDVDAVYYDMDSYAGLTSGNQGGIYRITDTYISLGREDAASGGVFDSTGFTQTSYNRGHISFWYQPD